MRPGMSPNDQFPASLSQLVDLSAPCKEKDHVEVRYFNDPISATHRLVLAVVLLVNPTLGGITLGGFRLPFQKRQVTIYVATPPKGRQVLPELIVHELAHARQIFRLGAPLFFAMYLFLLPFLFTFRGKLEYEAYAAEAEFSLWFRGDAGKAWYAPARFRKLMVSSDYVWAMTPKKARKSSIQMEQELFMISAHKRSGTTPKFHHLWMAPDAIDQLPREMSVPPVTSTKP